MAKKLFVIVLIGFIITFLLYCILYNTKKDFLAIGDSLAYGLTPYELKGYSFNDYIKESYKSNIKSYNDSYAIPNMSSRELLDLIITNNKLPENKFTIKQLIEQAEILTIAIGIDEINNKQNISLYLYNMDKILEQITYINKNKITLIGLYSPNNKIKDINNSLNNIAIKYKTNFLNIAELENDLYKYKENSYYLNLKGHEKISELYFKN